MTPPFLTPIELAARWRISPRTLERWRWAGEGLPFTKIGGRVLYSLADVEAYEAMQMRCVTECGFVIAERRVYAPKRGQRRNPLAQAVSRALGKNGRSNGWWTRR
jgi:DNA-binding transcriptional MerR regulator